MRVGIFGGSFDPPHYGHLLLAECCREQGRLDQVLFLPAAISPHKQHQPLTPPQHRVQMLRLAIGGHPAFEISTLEIDRGGISYTVETLEQLRQERPTNEWYLLMGADTLKDFPTWRQPQRICEMARLMVVSRVGAGEGELNGMRGISASFPCVDELSIVQMPLVQFSSREIRQLVAEGKSIRYRLPASVEVYIREYRLYAARDETFVSGGGEASGVPGTDLGL